MPSSESDEDTWARLAVKSQQITFSHTVTQKMINIPVTTHILRCSSFSILESWPFFEILFCILSYCAEFVFPVQFRTCVHVASHSVKCKLFLFLFVVQCDPFDHAASKGCGENHEKANQSVEKSWFRIYTASITTAFHSLRQIWRFSLFFLKTAAADGTRGNTGPVAVMDHPMKNGLVSLETTGL